MRPYYNPKSRPVNHSNFWYCNYSITICIVLTIIVLFMNQNVCKMKQYCFNAMHIPPHWIFTDFKNREQRYLLLFYFIPKSVRVIYSNIIWNVNKATRAKKVVRSKSRKSIQNIKIRLCYVRVIVYRQNVGEIGEMLYCFGRERTWKSFWFRHDDTMFPIDQLRRYFTQKKPAEE